MYSNTSNSYWKERQNKTNRSPLLAATLVVIALVAGTLLHRRYSTASLYNNDLLTQRRTVEQTTDTHWKQCESQVNSKNECTTICQPERNSIQRKTMHQACLQESPGCQQAHATATTLSCRAKVSTEEELFQEIGGLAYIHCSKFQSTEHDCKILCKDFRVQLLEDNATCKPALKHASGGSQKNFHMCIEGRKKAFTQACVPICKGSDLVVTSYEGCKSIAKKHSNQAFSWCRKGYESVLNSLSPLLDTLKKIDEESDNQVCFDTVNVT